MRGPVASAVLACLLSVTASAADKPSVDPDAVEALLRAELASSGRAADICVSVDEKPLAADVAQRLRDVGIRNTTDVDACPLRIWIGDFSYRPDLSTYEIRFTSQLFGGSSVAVMKHFTGGPDPGWHVVATYHVGVWL